jgi:hypothetical protein
MAQLAEAQFGAPTISAAGVAHELSALFVTVNAFDPAVDIAPSTNEISHRVLPAIGAAGQCATASG